MQSTSLIVPAPLWFNRAPEVVSHIPNSSEDECSRTVKDELGFDFPPVMGKCIEQLVRERWRSLKYQRHVFRVGEGLYTSSQTLSLCFCQ